MSANDKDAGQHSDRVVDTPQVRTEGSVLEDVNSVPPEKRLGIIRDAEGGGRDVPQGFKSPDGSDAVVVQKNVENKTTERVEQVGKVEVTKGMHLGVDSQAAVNVRVREHEEKTTTETNRGGEAGAIGARGLGEGAIAGRGAGREGAREGGREGDDEREGASEAADRRDGKAEDRNEEDAIAGEVAEQVEQALVGAAAGAAEAAGGAGEAGALAGKAAADAANAAGKGLETGAQGEHQATDAVRDVRKRK